MKCFGLDFAICSNWDSLSEDSGGRCWGGRTGRQLVRRRSRLKEVLRRGGGREKTRRKLGLRGSEVWNETEERQNVVITLVGTRIVSFSRVIFSFKN